MSDKKNNWMEAEEKKAQLKAALGGGNLEGGDAFFEMNQEIIDEMAGRKRKPKKTSRKLTELEKEAELADQFGSGTLEDNDVISDRMSDDRPELLEELSTFRTRDEEFTPEEEEVVEPEEDSSPISPSYGYDEDEADSLRAQSKSQIDSIRNKALKKIQTKKVLSQLVDALALYSGAQQGVESQINLGDSIDTSLDESTMKGDIATNKETLRDKLRDLRIKADTDYREKRDKYRDKSQLNKEATRKSEKEEASQLRRDNFNKNMAAAIKKESNRISKVLQKAKAAYDSHGDEEKFLEDLDIGNIPMSDEEKKSMIKKGWIWDDINVPGGQWIRDKANEAFGAQLKDRAIQSVATPVTYKKYNGKIYAVDENGDMQEVKR